MKRIKLIFLLFLLFLNVLILFQKGIITAGPAASPAEKPFEPLLSVFRLVRSEYIEEKDPFQTMDGALRGLVNSLDPLSGYLSRTATSLYLEQQKDTYLYETGLLVMKRYGFFPMVVGIIPNSPAQEADLRVGDYLTEINGQPTSPLSLIETRLLLKNKQRIPVSVKMLRDEQTRILSLERERLINHPYTFLAQAKTKGWLQVHGFFPPLASELNQKIIPRLIKSNTNEPLVIDLRTTEEGTLEEALKFLNLFLSGEKIGFYRDRNGNQQDLNCSSAAPLLETNLVVWVSPATQDLAELVAAALQTIKKAQVIGQTTPGLLAKREFFLLRDNTSFFLTTAIGGLLPEKTLWGKGVEPDIKLGPEEFDTSIYLQKTLSLQGLS